MNITAKNFKLITIFVLILNSIVLSSRASVVFEGAVSWANSMFESDKLVEDKPMIASRGKSMGYKVGFGIHDKIGKRVIVGLGLDAKMQTAPSHDEIIALGHKAQYEFLEQHKSFGVNIVLGIEPIDGFILYAKARYAKMHLDAEMNFGYGGRPVASGSGFFDSVGYSFGGQLPINKNLSVYGEMDFDSIARLTQIFPDGDLDRIFKNFSFGSKTLNIGLRIYL